MDLATGIQVGSQALGAIGGLVGGIGAEKRANKRMEKQHNYNKEIMDIQNNYLTQQNLQNQKLQMENWENTNAKAQVNQMKQAGLNIGLMYGGSGAGGQTSTGSQSAGAPSGTSGYSDGGLEAQGMAIMSQMPMQIAQMELMKAQKDNIDADTDKKKEETNLTTWNINDIKQGIKNKEALETATHIENDIKRVEFRIKDASTNDTLEIISNQAKQTGIDLKILKRQDQFDETTYNDRVKQVYENLSLTIAQKAGIEANTEVQKKVKEYYDKYYQVALQNANANTKNAESNARNATTNEKNAQTNSYNSATLREGQKNNYRGILANEHGIFENAEQQQLRTQLQNELQTHQITHDNINLLLDAPVKIFNALKVWQ